jgi:hypothetical protein
LLVGRNMGQADLQMKGDYLSYKIYAVDEGAFVDMIAQLLPQVTSGMATAGGTESAASETKRQAALDQIAQAVDRLSEAILDLHPTDGDSAPASARSEEARGETEERASTPPVEADSMWECPVCTLLNPPHVYECTVCTSPRPTAAADTGAGAVAGAAASAPPTTESGAVGWWCRVCTFINTLSQPR